MIHIYRAFFRPCPRARGTLFCCQARRICCFCARWAHWNFQGEKKILVSFLFSFFLSLFFPYLWWFFFCLFPFPLFFPFIFPLFCFNRLNHNKGRELARDSRLCRIGMLWSDPIDRAAFKVEAVLPKLKTQFEVDNLIHTGSFTPNQV